MIRTILTAGIDLTFNARVEVELRVWFGEKTMDTVVETVVIPIEGSARLKRNGKRGWTFMTTDPEDPVDPGEVALASILFDAKNLLIWIELENVKVLLEEQLTLEIGKDIDMQITRIY